MENMLVTRKVFSRTSAGCRSEEGIRSAAFAANDRAKALFMSALLAAVLAAFALPSFASSTAVQPAESSSAPPKADPGYPKPRLSEAETRRGMQCGSGKGPSEAECFKLRKKAFEEGQDRLDYERAHWTPADRKLAERASRELDSGKDDVGLPKLVSPSKNQSRAEPNGKGACKMVWKVVGDESSCHAEGRNLIVNPGITSEQLATGWTDPKTGDNSYGSVPVK